MSETAALPRLFDDSSRSTRPELQTPAPLPMTPKEVEARGWSEVDVVFITGDAYVDSPSFANGLLARVLEKDGFKVAILSQPDWNSVDEFRKFGRPRLAFCISAGNMDSMINHYTANRKVRNDDAYSPGGKIGRRPDRATLAYCQRAREAFPGVPIITGGIEASLRRVVHYDYWSDKIRRSIAMDAKCDLLIYGMGERPLLTVLRRLAAGESIQNIRDVRGTVYKLGRTEDLPEESRDIAHLPSYEDLQEIRNQFEVPRDIVDPREVRVLKDRFEKETKKKNKLAKLRFVKMTQVIFENLNPFCAKTLIQEHGDEAIVINPPDYPLSEEDINDVYALPFTRKAHPSYQETVPAAEVVRSSVQTHRGCFGGCSFCAITAHQGKFIQSRSEDAIVAEIRNLASESGGNYIVSDLNAPTANMYRLAGKKQQACRQCTRTSCLCPEVCPNLNVDHSQYRVLLQKTREVEGVKNVLIASGIRTDLALFSPEFIKDLAEFHTGGHLKTAPEHVDDEVLRLMNKPPIKNYERFCNIFSEASHKLGKEQYLVPYLIAGFPGCTLSTMVQVAEYLKKHNIRPEQVQDFIPTPFSLATCAYYTGIDPISENPIYVPRGLRERRLQHALLFYYKADFYHDVKSALKEADREDLIGTDENSLIPPYPAKLQSLRRTSRVKKYIRDEKREAKRKEEWRAQFIEEEDAQNQNSRRIGRNHSTSNGGYRRSARDFGSRYVTSAREWDAIDKTWKTTKDDDQLSSSPKHRDHRGRSSVDSRRFNTQQKRGRSRFHDSDYRNREYERPFVKNDVESDSFRRRNVTEGEEFRRDTNFEPRDGGKSRFNRNAEASSARFHRRREVDFNRSQERGRYSERPGSQLDRFDKKHDSPNEGSLVSHEKKNTKRSFSSDHRFGKSSDASRGNFTNSKGFKNFRNGKKNGSFKRRGN